MTYRELLIELRKKLSQTDGDQAAHTARELCAYAADKTREALLRDDELLVPENVRERALAITDDYLAGKPLAYILGQWSFYGLDFSVNESVLIPRNDTMAVTDLAIEFAKPLSAPRILDLCTGSGCIGIALAHYLPSSRVTLADISDDALRVAKKNVTANRLSARVSAIRADALSSPPLALRNYDLIVSNPPYVTESEMRTLDPSVKDYEPHLALRGGEDGLTFYRAICRNYAQVLHDQGAICFEFGMGQEFAVKEILQENGFSDFVFRRDGSDIIRAVIARKNGKE